MNNTQMNSPVAFNSAVCVGAALAGGAIGYSAQSGHTAFVLILSVSILFGALSALANVKW